MRSHGGEREKYSLDSEDVSPAKANPFRPRYAKISLVNLPKVVKPASMMKKCVQAVIETIGVVGEGAHRKTRRGNPGRSVLNYYPQMN